MLVDTGNLLWTNVYASPLLIFQKSLFCSLNKASASTLQKKEATEVVEENFLNSSNKTEQAVVRVTTG
jgi:hypothetical protein